MTEQASFTLRGRNPDVLTCIANLSNDEVFTPPELANKMLDTLEQAWADSHDGANIWKDSSVKFLDPCTKSGVFLREIAKRLIIGLSDEFPDLQTRVNHILTRQVFGIAITRLTSLLARRSLYCSKYANGAHSVVSTFKDTNGNIWFERTEHNWVGEKCRFCGATRRALDRGDDLETYAYPFIHAEIVQSHSNNIFGEHMQFDVVIGNPPYQMAGGAGGTSDSSIYHLFVNQAIELNPRYLCMVIPSRWMAGGRGLDEFRAKMLNSGHVRQLVDFSDSSDAFPGVQIKGGICYFLWDGQSEGRCDVTRIVNGDENSQKDRILGEFDVFIRDSRALGILRKVLAKKEKSIINLVSGDTPFGIATNFQDWSPQGGNEKIPLHLINKSKRSIGFVDRNLISKNSDSIDSWKVFIPEAYGAGESFPHQILGKEIVASPPSVCTQSFLFVCPFQSEKEALSFASYYRTRFFRFLVSLRKITQHALRSTYTWVPQQSWEIIWTDDALYKKYEISGEEVEYIEKMVKKMDQVNE